MILVQVQLKIFNVLVKDDELNCFDDILVYIKKLPELEKSMINEIITICKLLLSLVNPPGNQRSWLTMVFRYEKVENVAPFDTMTQDGFSNPTILNNHKQRTDKLCLLDVANEFVGRNENRKRNFTIFKETDLNF